MFCQFLNLPDPWPVFCVTMSLFPARIVVVSYQVIPQLVLCCSFLILSVHCCLSYLYKWNFDYVLHWFSICLQGKIATSLHVITK